MKKLALLLTLFVSTAFAAPQEIVLWHAFDGFLQEVFEEIIADFNIQTQGYTVAAKKMGNYSEIVEEAMQLQGSGRQPHILQVYEVATLTAMQAPEAFVPLEDLMETYFKKFDRGVYIDAVRAFYTSPEGKMMSLPWNASTGILFYNKKAFAKAGLDPEHSPHTWEELEGCFEALRRVGYKGYTTAWPAAYHLEHVCCWHNLPFASEGNGFDAPHSKLLFNSVYQVQHLQKVAEWQKKGYFQYAGRFTSEPENLFTSGQCAILLQGANRLPLISRNADFEIGVGYMPYWASITEKPYNLNIGGSSLWAMNGFSDTEYQGVVELFKFLSSTEVQAYWHQKTGYLPITDAAYYLTKKKGFYEKNPAAEIAVLEVMGNAPTPYTRGVRLPNYMQVREVIIDQLEKAILGEIPAKEALDNAVKEGNILLNGNEKP